MRKVEEIFEGDYLIGQAGRFPPTILYVYKINIKERSITITHNGRKQEWNDKNCQDWKMFCDACEIGNWSLFTLEP